MIRGLKCVDALGEATRIAFSSYAIAGCGCEVCTSIRESKNEKRN